VGGSVYGYDLCEEGCGEEEGWVEGLVSVGWGDVVCVGDPVGKEILSLLDCVSENRSRSIAYMPHRTRHKTHQYTSLTRSGCHHTNPPRNKTERKRWKEPFPSYFNTGTTEHKLIRKLVCAAKEGFQFSGTQLPRPPPGKRYLAKK
jgi:hypothetical protein